MPGTVYRFRALRQTQLGKLSPELAQLGASPAMQRVDNQLRRIAPLDATVLIRGETGTGKKVVARRLHQLSG